MEKHIASFSSPVLPAFKVEAQTVDLHYFSDDRSLIVLLAGGDIAVLQLEHPSEGIAPVSGEDGRAHERLR